MLCGKTGRGDRSRGSRGKQEGGGRLKAKSVICVLLAVLLLSGCAAKAVQSVDMEEQGMKTIYLAGGCFWGVQKFFDQFDGVIATETGYANGPDKAPTYRDVCSSSGHAETVKIVYDESRITLTELLNYYFMIIDPLSVNKQGNDRGIQYRTGIYYTDADQLPEIEAVYSAQETKTGARLAVEKEPLKNFYPAEEYHQKYLDKNPNGYCHIKESFFTIQEKIDRGEL